MSKPKELFYSILKLRLEYLEKYRQTTSLSDFQLWEIYEYIDPECQLQVMRDVEVAGGQ